MSDQQAGEEVCEIEQCQSGRESLNGGGHPGGEDRGLDWRAGGRRRYVADRVDARLGGRSRVVGPAGVATAAVRDGGGPGAVMLPGFTQRMGVPGEHRAASRSDHCDGQDNSRQASGQTCHDCRVHCSADASRRAAENRAIHGPRGFRAPGAHAKFPCRCGKIRLDSRSRRSTPRLPVCSIFRGNRATPVTRRAGVREATGSRRRREHTCGMSPAVAPPAGGAPCSCDG